VILCDVSAPSTRDQYNFVNRVVLLLNTVILVVTFLLAYSSSSSQIGLLEASVRSSGGTQRIGVRSHDDVAFLRLVQSLGNRIQKLTRAQLRAVREAMLLYRQATSAAVSDALDGDGSEPAKAELDLVGKRVRLQIEETLKGSIPDDALVRQLTTAVIRFG